MPPLWAHTTSSCRQFLFDKGKSAYHSTRDFVKSLFSAQGVSGVQLKGAGAHRAVPVGAPDSNGTVRLPMFGTSGMCIPRKGIGLPIRPWTLIRKDLELLEFRQLTRVRWIGTAIALAGIWLFTSLKFGPERCLERHRTAAAAPEVPPVPGRGSEQGAGLWFASEAHSGLQLE